MRYAVHTVHARSPANLNPASSPKKETKPVKESKPQSPSNAAPGNLPSRPKPQRPVDSTTPTFKIIRVTTPIDTCRLPSVRCEDDYDNVGNLEEEDALVARALEKRGGTREYKAKLGKKGTIKFNSLGYLSSSELFKTREGQALPKTVFDFNDRTSLQDIAVKDLNVIPKDYTSYVTEHIIELQTVKLFLESLSGASDAITLSQTVDGSFIQDHWTEKFTVTKVASRTHKPTITTGKRQTLNDLVYKALGSSFNRADFVLCDKEINSYKERVWTADSPMNDDTLDDYIKFAISGALPSTYFSSPFRTTLAVFKYLEHATITTPKLQKLNAELKQKDTALTNAKKEEDAARKVVKDIEDKIDKEPTQAQKKAIRTKEDLSGKDALEKKEKASLDALKAKNLDEREIHVLQLQTVKGLVVSAEADQDQLEAYKAAVVAIKMPKAV
ncbi:hypothetical protein G6514_001552 [Epicoccum nigrum]|nr:hypothetical protein G6514_001552 [Epicoccum nigrum]